MLSLIGFYDNFKAAVERDLMNGARWQPATVRCKIVDEKYTNWQQVIKEARQQARVDQTLSCSDSERLLTEIANAKALVAKVCFDHGRPDLSTAILNDAETQVYPYASWNWKRIILLMKELTAAPTDGMIPVIRIKVSKDVWSRKRWIREEDGALRVAQHYLAWYQILKYWERNLTRGRLSDHKKNYLKMLASTYTYAARVCQFHGRDDLSRMFLRTGNDLVVQFGSPSCRRIFALLIQLQADGMHNDGLIGFGYRLPSTRPYAWKYRRR